MEFTRRGRSVHIRPVEDYLRLQFDELPAGETAAAVSDVSHQPAAAAPLRACIGPPPLAPGDVRQGEEAEAKGGQRCLPKPFFIYKFHIICFIYLL